MQLWQFLKLSLRLKISLSDKSYTKNEGRLIPGQPSIFRYSVRDLKQDLNYFNYVCFDSTLWAILILRCVSIEKFMNKPTFLAHVSLMKHSTLVCEIFFFQVFPMCFCFEFHTLTSVQDLSRYPLYRRHQGQHGSRTHPPKCSRPPPYHKRYKRIIES